MRTSAPWPRKPPAGPLRSISLARTVLRAAREMTLESDVSDQAFAELRAGLGDERLTDLMVTLSFHNGLVRLLAAMRVDVEDDYLAYLDEFPLPPP